MIVNAVFDSADSAEWALVRMRERGVDVKNYKVLPINRRHEFTSGGDPVIMAENGVSAANWGYGNNMGMGGSAWLPFTAFESPMRTYDVISQEALLEVTIDDSDYGPVKATMVSNRGRKVQRKSDT